jgi:hypothetical protein
MLGTSLFALPGMVWGQQPARSLEQLQVLVAPGDDLTVVHRTGITTRGQLSAVGPEEVVLDVGGNLRRWREPDIRAIWLRGNDTIVNGIVIGAAIGAALGSLNYLDNDCRGDAGCAAGLALGAAMCAGAGGLIDALIRPSRLIYAGAPTGAMRLVRPAFVSPGWRAAVGVSVRF